MLLKTNNTGTTMPARLIALIILSQLVSSCSENNTVTTERLQPAKPRLESINCDPLHGMTPYCGFKNPEDLVIVPGGEKLLVSEMGEFMLDAPGALSLFDLTSGEKQSIQIDWLNEGESWGEKDCPVPEADLFSPHGIDLIVRNDGKHQLLVVNHGGREAVEFFALTKPDDQWQLAWKGCASPPGDPFINDVAGLSDGGFLVTHMWNKSQPFEKVVERLLAGEHTGWVWEWQKGQGFNKLPGSTELMPNGIAVSEDNQKVFINIYMANKTIKLDRATGQLEGEIKVQQPDNITIDEAGDLWIASHKHDPIKQTCTEVKEGPCLLPFEIVKADATNMRSEVILSHEGSPMGFSTVALKVGNKIFMGSAHGDRIVSYVLPAR
jgi:hypothetical protein